jgi:hypothetical protein
VVWAVAVVPCEWEGPQLGARANRNDAAAGRQRLAAVLLCCCAGSTENHVKLEPHTAACIGIVSTPCCVCRQLLCASQPRPSRTLQDHPGRSKTHPMLGCLCCRRSPIAAFLRHHE